MRNSPPNYENYAGQMPPQSMYTPQQYQQVLLPPRDSHCSVTALPHYTQVQSAQGPLFFQGIQPSSSEEQYVVD